MQIDQPEAALLGLQLAPDELDALRHQGFVASETRGSGTTVHKLHFRIKGRQRVRYLGTDVKRAAEVRKALEVFQQQRRLTRHIAARAGELKAILRTIKPRLSQPALAAGFIFHGRRLRRPRRMS